MSTPIMTDPSSIDARLRDFGVVDAAVETHGNDGADLLNTRFTAGDREPPVDYHIVVADLGGELRSARDAMIAANDAHVGVLAGIVGMRKERDTLNNPRPGRSAEAGGPKDGESVADPPADVPAETAVTPSPSADG